MEVLMRKLVFLFLGLMLVGCAGTSGQSFENNTCTNNVPSSDIPFKAALASSIMKKAQAAYTLGYPEVEIDLMLFDQFYLYYKENAYYESGCSSDFDEKSIEQRFKRFAITAMVEGRNSVDDPVLAMTQDYAEKVMTMNIKEMFALLSKG
jgi:hypothetical protein